MTVSVLVYQLMFIFGDTLLDKVPPGSPGSISQLFRATLRASFVGLFAGLGINQRESRIPVVSGNDQSEQSRNQEVESVSESRGLFN